MYKVCESQRQGCEYIVYEVGLAGKKITGFDNYNFQNHQDIVLS